MIFGFSLMSVWMNRENNIRKFKHFFRNYPKKNDKKQQKPPREDPDAPDVPELPDVPEPLEIPDSLDSLDSLELPELPELPASPGKPARGCSLVAQPLGKSFYKAKSLLYVALAALLDVDA